MFGRAGFGLAALIPVVLLVSFACGPQPPCLLLLEAISQQNVEVVRKHLELGQDPNEIYILPGLDLAGAYALHAAVIAENEEIAELLLENGADINIRAKDQYGGTPLQWAAFVGSNQMVGMLVEAGADINAPDKDGLTPLDAAFSNPDLDSEIKTEIADYLRMNGAMMDRS